MYALNTDAIVMPCFHSTKEVSKGGAKQPNNPEATAFPFH